MRINKLLVPLAFSMLIGSSVVFIWGFQSGRAELKAIEQKAAVASEQAPFTFTNDQDDEICTFTSTEDPLFNIHCLDFSNAVDLKIIKFLYAKPTKGTNEKSSESLFYTKLAECEYDTICIDSVIYEELKYMVDKVPVFNNGAAAKYTTFLDRSGLIDQKIFALRMIGGLLENITQHNLLPSSNYDEGKGCSFDYYQHTGLVSTMCNDDAILDLSNPFFYENESVDSQYMFGVRRFFHEDLVSCLKEVSLSDIRFGAPTRWTLNVGLNNDCLTLKWQHENFLPSAISRYIPVTIFDQNCQSDLNAIEAAQCADYDIYQLTKIIEKKSDELLTHTGTAELVSKLIEPLKRSLSIQEFNNADRQLNEELLALQGPLDINIQSPLLKSSYRGEIRESNDISNPAYDYYYSASCCLWEMELLSENIINISLNKNGKKVSAECKLSYLETLKYTDRQESFGPAYGSATLKGYVNIFNLEPINGKNVFMNPDKDVGIQPCQQLYVYGSGRNFNYAIGAELDHYAFETEVWPSNFVLFSD